MNMTSVNLGTHADTALQDLHGPACLQACVRFYHVNFAQQCVFKLKHCTLVNHDALVFDITLHASAFHLLFTLFISVGIFLVFFSQDCVCKCVAGVAFSMYVMLLTSSCT